MPRICIYYCLLLNGLLNTAVKGVDLIVASDLVIGDHVYESIYRIWLISQ